MSPFDLGAGCSANLDDSVVVTRFFLLEMLVGRVDKQTPGSRRRVQHRVSRRGDKATKMNPAHTPGNVGLYFRRLHQTLLIIQPRRS